MLLSFGYGSPNLSRVPTPWRSSKGRFHLSAKVSGGQAVRQLASQLDAADSVQGLGSRGQTEQADGGRKDMMDGWTAADTGKITYNAATDGRFCLYFCLAPS